MLDFGFASEQEIRAELGKRLRAQRLVQFLSQIELAERAAISVSTLKLLESKGQCTLENFIRTALGLGLADEMQSLFIPEIKSIAQMEQAEQAKRVRAPRKSAVAKLKQKSLPLERLPNRRSENERPE
jgi:transcriptional regulator with XRE-family HTH domain